MTTRTRLGVALGATVGGASRRLRMGGGSVIGGRVQLMVDPDALTALTVGRPVLLVSGTNGKSTTTAFTAAALATRAPVVTNSLGANMPPGLVATLAHAAPGTAAVLEVDEHWLPSTMGKVRPVAVSLLNLSRDQMDRTAEVRTLAGSWRTAVAAAADTHVIANADDPLVAWAALAAKTVTWVAAGQPWTEDAWSCPQCAGRLVFSPEGDTVTGSVSRSVGWSCTGCDLARPDPDVWLEESPAGDTAGDTAPERTIVTRQGERIPLHLGLPGRCNGANAAMAMAAAVVAGVPAADAVAAAGAITDVAGRYRVFPVGDGRARLLLAKNPAGWLEVLDMLGGDSLPVVIAINARAADGRDPSWLWDVPFERLRGRPVVATGERSRDLAVRLAYAEVPHRHLPDIDTAIRFVQGSDMYVVANYTAFQAVRGLL
jgi:UDP-N-acetylmuramyl tripeptide synthase